MQSALIGQQTTVPTPNWTGVGQLPFSRPRLSLACELQSNQSPCRTFRVSSKHVRGVANFYYSDKPFPTSSANTTLSVRLIAPLWWLCSLPGFLERLCGSQHRFQAIVFQDSHSSRLVHAHPAQQKGSTKGYAAGFCRDQQFQATVVPLRLVVAISQPASHT